MDPPTTTTNPEDDPFTKVYLDITHKHTNSPFLHNFYDCTLDLFGLSKEDSSYINVKLDTTLNRIVISPSKKGEIGAVPFEHAHQCPVRFIPSDSPLLEKKPQPYVRIGVAVLVENDKGEILITRRAAHMRTFPSTWVIPGGHIEKGETFEEAGVRELEEETGIRVPVSEAEIFCVYESVYPVLLSEGDPLRHHIVIYLKCKATSEQIQWKLSYDEVGAASWIDETVVRGALSSKVSDIPLSFTGLEAIQGEWNHAVFPVSTLQSIPDENNRLPNERLSTGSQVVLRQWLLEKTNNSSQEPKLCNL